MILCCGEALVDMVPQMPQLPQMPQTAQKGAESSPYGSFEVRPGGSIYNSAIAAARLGARTGFMGRIASDFLGDKLFSRLTANGVDTSLVRRSPEPVTLAFVERNAEGEAAYAFYSQGAADRMFAPEDIPARLPEAADFLLVGSISLVQEPSASTIEALMRRETHSRLISYDPNVRASLIPDRKAFAARFEALCAMSAIVKASTVDMEWIYGSGSPEDYARKIFDAGRNKGVAHGASGGAHDIAQNADHGAQAVFLTMGSAGALAFTRRAQAFAPAVPVQVVDTIGAGDTFHAGILVALAARGIKTRAQIGALREESLRQVLLFAGAAAALNCTRKGAEPPSLQELASAHPELAITI